MKTLTSGIRIAIEKAMAIYNTNIEMKIKNEETGFTVEIVLPHVTDHIFQEIKNHVKFLTGQSIKSWDILPQEENLVRLILRITNKQEPKDSFMRKKNHK